MRDLSQDGATSIYNAGRDKGFIEGVEAAFATPPDELEKRVPKDVMDRMWPVVASISAISQPDVTVTVSSGQGMVTPGGHN